MPQQKKHWSESRTFGTAVVALLLLVSGALVWQHANSSARLRAETEAQAQLRAAQVTSAATSAVSLLFRTVDITARDLAAAYAQGRGAGFEPLVRTAIERLPAGAVLQIAVIGADGYLAYSNLGMSGKVFLGDREHFTVHREGGGDRLFISKPLLGRVSRQWSIQFSRPITRDGQFAGVLVMSMSPGYLQEALAAVTLGSDDSLTVIRQTGEFMARNREMESALGKSADPTRPFLAPGAAPAGRFIARSLIDDVERISHWQRLDPYPVYVVLGLSSRTVYQPVEWAIAEDQLKTVVGLGLMWVTGIGMALLARRVSAQARQREELEQVAMTDSMTGLQSRHALMNHLNEAVAHAARNGERVGLLYMDLNGFKPVNDRFGHAAGDQVLRVVGGRIRACVRGGDMAARIGGDEFVVVLDPLPEDDALVQLRARIARTLTAPISIGGIEMQVGASIGLAVYPDDGDSADALLMHADQDMYRRKAKVA
ncbi:diguanylate cyclase domain-containing protein [Ramlibacter sp. MAHUQ-53]|uniref:diguanylate cyclase domain-containing protein n=1 Tax=unclassified Ramlibacter TaxID=2617605 RepID=UPI00362ECDB0